MRRLGTLSLLMLNGIHGVRDHSNETVDVENAGQNQELEKRSEMRPVHWLLLMLGATTTLGVEVDRESSNWRSVSLPNGLHDRPAILGLADHSPMSTWPLRANPHLNPVAVHEGNTDQSRILVSSTGLDTIPAKLAFLELLRPDHQDLPPEDEILQYLQAQTAGQTSNARNPFENLKATVFSDASVFRLRFRKAGSYTKPESFKDQLMEMGAKSENLKEVNLIEKPWLPEGTDKSDWNALVEEAGQLYKDEEENGGMKPTPGKETISKRMVEKSAQLDEKYDTHLNNFIDGIQARGIILGDGGDVVISNMAFRVNKAVTESLHRSIQSGNLVGGFRSATAMVASADMGLSTEVTDNYKKEFLDGDTSGALNVFGNFAVRPHYTKDKFDKDFGGHEMQCEVKDGDSGEITKIVMPLADQDAVVCKGTANCGLVSQTYHPGEPVNYLVDSWFQPPEPFIPAASPLPIG